MSGRWEQYVGDAARAGHDAFFASERYGGDGELVPVKRAEVWHATARAILDVVGPLIAEDTRVRMVEAAGRAVERGGQIMGPNEAYGLRTCCPSPPAGPHTMVCLVGRGMLADPTEPVDLLAELDKMADEEDET